MIYVHIGAGAGDLDAGAHFRDGFSEFVKQNDDGDKRIYFGPVTLYKFRIRLLNDKGLLVDLNNMDWSFSLLITQVYQY